MNLVKISQEEIIKILSEHYNLKPNQITLHTDYHFIKRNDDKVREDIIYAIKEATIEGTPLDGVCIDSFGAEPCKYKGGKSDVKDKNSSM